MGLYTEWTKRLAPAEEDGYAPTSQNLDIWPRTVGGRIMAYCEAHAIDPNTHQGMQDIVHQFNEPQNLRWTWNPGRGCRSGDRAATLLDNLAAGECQGECGWLAWALYILLIAPPPYGFGLALTQHNVKVYSGLIGVTSNGIANHGGQEGEGFFSMHPRSYHNLPPNTYNLTSNALDLYRWGDHVVVEWNGRYWDPSYDAWYANLYDMALFNTAQLNSALVDPRNRNGGFNITWRVRANGSLIDEWFRQLQPREIATYPAGSGIIGPYAAAPAAPQPVVVAQVPRTRRRNCFWRFFCCFGR